MFIQKEESVKLPPLENGDRLTRDEFERRYQAMQNVKKAELIDKSIIAAKIINRDRQNTHPLNSSTLSNTLLTRSLLYSSSNSSNNALIKDRRNNMFSIQI